MTSAVSPARSVFSALIVSSGINARKPLEASRRPSRRSPTPSPNPFWQRECGVGLVKGERGVRVSGGDRFAEQPAGVRRCPAQPVPADGSPRAPPARQRCRSLSAALLRAYAPCAARLAGQRRVSTSATVQAFATSFLRFARPACRLEPDRLRPDRVEDRLCRSRTSPGPDASTTSPTPLRRLPGADHGTVRECGPSSSAARSRTPRRVHAGGPAHRPAPTPPPAASPPGPRLCR